MDSHHKEERMKLRESTVNVSDDVQREVEWERKAVSAVLRAGDSWESESIS